MEFYRFRRYLVVMSHDVGLWSADFPRLRPIYGWRGWPLCGQTVCCGSANWASSDKIPIHPTSGGYRGGWAAPPPLGDGLTPSLTAMLANAKLWSFYCKTWYSEYSKWLPSVTFWQLWSAQNSFFARTQARTPLGELTALPKTPSWFKGH